MSRRPQVLVPMVVGMTVLAGRHAAAEAQGVLAPPNADGPPLGALLWAHESDYVIASQTPAAGTVARPHDSVRITYIQTGEEGPGTAGDREPRRPKPTPDSLFSARPLEDVEHAGDR